MTDKPPSTSFLNYPEAIAHDIPYTPPPPGNNPVFRGLLLDILSRLVAVIPGAAYLLWWNAGFGTLRDCKALEGVYPRYDPTVIPTSTATNTKTFIPKSIEELRVRPKTDTFQFNTTVDFYKAYHTGKHTPTQVIESMLPHICKDLKERSVNATAFAIIEVELVREAAKASTLRWKAGKQLSILDGVPFAVKDDLEVQGYRRYAGTSHDHTIGKDVAETSWCVKKLQEQGAVLIGTLNMHELGMDTTGNNPIWGTPLNPYNKHYYPGGSSGGAASAVAAGVIPFAIGSDGGGSIRIPASYCGVYGLKPTHNRVSTAPMINAEKTVTVRGPLASSMADLEISYRVIAQPDPNHKPSSLFSSPGDIKSPRRRSLGICRSWFERADPEVQAVCQTTLDYLCSELNYELIDISIPLLHEGQLAHAMTILAEGASCIQPSIYSLTPANRILASVGRQTPAIDFLLAQRVRNILMQHLASLFQRHPGLIIVTPTTPNAGWHIRNADLSHGISNTNMSLRSMEYVWLANFTGIPCIQFPVGYIKGVRGSGMVPIGLSGQSEWGSEDALLEFGYDGERWLHDGHNGGRLKPEFWLDSLTTKLKQRPVRS